MTEEIKEIDIKKDLYLCSPLLNKECTKENCYINNGSCCHTVNKEYSQEHLLNYITNLQKEKDDYKSRNEKAIEFVKSMEYCGQEDYFYDLKSKDPCGNDNTFNDSKYKLLNILQGGDE